MIATSQYTVQHVPLPQTQQFGQLFLDFLAQKEWLAPLHGHYPSVFNFEKQIALKQGFSSDSRNTLTQVLREQYANITVSPEVSNNIEALLQPNTFTITTGHQLNIFTGPLYFIYKIVTVINVSQKLSEQFPQYNFVPVYWAATEDHDAAEINHFNLFGKKYEWTTAQTGAVGRFSTEGLGDLLDTLPERFELFEKAYREHRSLSEATCIFINELFGNQGLVMLDADHAAFKKALRPVMQQDIFEQLTQKQTATAQTLLEANGHKPQIHIREINFFYLDKNVRERIVKDGETYRTLNTDLVWTTAQMAELIENSPEKLSPNVSLRPVYQELILPNLSYTGGAAEVAYWLQLKPVFDALHLPYPILLPRNFVLFITAANAKKISKLELSQDDIWRDEASLKQQYLAEVGAEFSAEIIQKQIQQLFEQLGTQAAQADKTLQDFVKAEAARTEKIVEGIEKRVRKAEEKKHETAINQIISLKQKLFPNGGLQERSENFLNYYANNPLFIKQLLETIDPFRIEFHVLTESI
ncbi:bacillithiol biosynthesis cysteine-adding enzyme BshC [Flexibacter flexilis DSM 6793]|uniref:Putative cysteine ligase BshC n=1 Tax=Flexibacter flexilis DSM 6793 TaxID=927664 RepID=A0A1I1NIB5_9BACT|nr:bacillithiol biosynthesis cysteine-adding enzyme BshC [Flexibacter flexilis]SFC97277.1 bacillithiol biosynthesis cysteine-adding enzyme BshC [Flexibacter flexilis DSM 6793]